MLSLRLNSHPECTNGTKFFEIVSVETKIIQTEIFHMYAHNFTQGGVQNLE